MKPVLISKLIWLDLLLCAAISIIERITKKKKKRVENLIGQLISKRDI
ncbi:hypothetical protein CFP56_020104 [Quercus suber]|uniref:Uncharacterized protein n=1 Tax=Quercus suber TaxID=58331 RepID=A0AAW0KG94_QUESU